FFAKAHQDDNTMVSACHSERKRRISGLCKALLRGRGSKTQDPSTYRRKGSFVNENIIRSVRES
ncbi:MAG: hypothetical protein COW89_11780, partial [Nitrospinae bacterium CG22_combo_CG10-13_8_21_14_all_47_10]